ncbi:MAG: hypothetical protein SGI74_01950 [Oligoflexia bacterium]|nr:hypothetical protein [Oligoflexia bacterium]
MTLEQKIYERIIQYAQTTNIEFANTPRYSGWEAVGLPDMRGFTPHLRKVNVYKDLEKPKFNSKKFTNLWLVHDILHIAFYDFVSLNLGVECWNDPARFLECHLASEAFAVLTLDYHCLIKTSVKGLAVDLDKKDLTDFQRFNNELPDFESFKFCQGLVDFYLSGQWAFSNHVEIEHEVKMFEKIKQKYENWFGHEFRYAEKQRYYALLWLEDLHNKRSTKQKAMIEDSSVAAPLWELITLFTSSSETEWMKYLKDIKKSTQDVPNYFKDMPKYHQVYKKPDYRLTDMRSVSKGQIATEVKQTTKPSAGHLFLFWQILTSQPSNKFTAAQKKEILKLATQAQTSRVESKLWKSVQATCCETINLIDWKIDSQGASTFFLP